MMNGQNEESCRRDERAAKRRARGLAGGGGDELNEAFAKKPSIVFDAAITDSGIEILYKGDLKDWKVSRLLVSLEGIHWERVE